MSEERAKQLADLVSKVSFVFSSQEVSNLHIFQTKSAPNPDDMQNMGGDIMKKFAAVVKYEIDDIHNDHWPFLVMTMMMVMVMMTMMMVAEKIFQEPKARSS